MEEVATEKKLSQTMAIGMILVCSVLWSIGGLFIKMIPWNAMIISGTRSVIACGILYIYLKATKGKMQINKTTVMGGIFFSLTLILFVNANKLTTSANAIVLQYLSPVVILLGGIFFDGKKARKRDFAVVAISIIGIALFFMDKLDGGHLLGNILALLSAFTMALVFTIGNKSKSRDESVSYIIIGHLITFVVSVPFMFIYGVELSTTAISGILILGIFQLGLPYILFCSAIRYCTPLSASLVSMAEPLLSPIWVGIFLKEIPGTMAIIGGVIVIVSVTMWCISNVNQKAIE